MYLKYKDMNIVCVSTFHEEFVYFPIHLSVSYTRGLCTQFNNTFVFETFPAPVRGAAATA